ncbi:MAG: flagellar hook-length control protein FliK, partial [Desulfobacteraceae bacterium]|nr:flagellar hook-length control protein FliK [Desulfobacteraceae bacterium]
FLESILNSLGISKRKIEEILAQADRGKKGINIDVVIENLRALQKESFYNNTQYNTREGDNNINLLLKHLGLQAGTSKTSVLTLNEFVDSLSKLRQKISQQSDTIGPQSDLTQKAAGDEKDLDLFRTLFKGLELKDKAGDTRTVEFSFEQIRDQFKDQLLASENKNTNKKGLFSLDKKIKHATGKNLENAFKEMESFLNGKKEGSNEVKDQLKGTEEFIKQLKSKSAKFSDQSQVSSSEVKSGETQPNIGLLKTKSTFKNLPTYVTNQVSKSLVRAINQGENTLKIQLKPPELGRLVMTIDNTGNSMKVSIITENHAAKEILSSNMNEIKTVLSNSGVNLEKFEVDMNSNFKQSMADAKNPAGNSGKRHRNREKVLFDSNGEKMIDTASLLDTLNQDGSLHFVA